MTRITGICALTIGLALQWAAVTAQADDFYTNRQITLLIGNNAGTSYDVSARLIGRHIGRLIPGMPTIVPKNMPGASGLIATNYAANIASQDGSVLVAALQTIPLRQVLGDENVKFDAAKLQWIGNPATSVNVIVTWHTSPVKTIADAKAQVARMGATTRDAASGVEVALANNLLGTKFKLVTGYKGNDIDLAMERGEVDGRAGQSWDGWKLTKPDWVRDKKLTVLVQLGLARAKDLPDVPLLTELASTEEQKKILDLFAIPIALGRPLFVAAGVPADHVALLRAAFRATMQDDKFLAEANRLNLDVDPIYGEALQALVQRMLATPAATVAKAQQAMTYKE
jgi:tripartite-type tricarboxylate transporter receptor subunit TctC